VHLPDHLGHAVQCLRRRLDQHIHAVVESVELTVGDDAGDLDERILREIKPGHLAVDPDEPVSH
jgi:hypothetical protein